MYRCGICGTEINELDIKIPEIIQCSECGADNELRNQRLIALYAGPSEE
jgi:hypothetical protein